MVPIVACIAGSDNTILQFYSHCDDHLRGETFCFKERSKFLIGNPATYRKFHHVPFSAPLRLCNLWNQYSPVSARQQLDSIQPVAASMGLHQACSSAKPVESMPYSTFETVHTTGEPTHIVLDQVLRLQSFSS